MTKGLFIVFLTVWQWNYCVCVPASYQRQRDAIVQKEMDMRIGSHWNLTDDEKIVNNIFLGAKKNDYFNARVNNSFYPPAQNFFQSKKFIDKSLVFQMIEKMPKGCALHIHDSSVASLDWFIQNVTYRDNLYICFNSVSGKPSLHFYSKAPANPDCYWELISAVRKRSGDAKVFDEELYKNLSIIVDNPDDVYKTVDDVWQKFNDYFSLLNGAFQYVPVFQDYFRRALSEFYQDNVQCVELRVTLSPIYELDGSVKSPEWIVNAYRTIAKEFIQQNPDFLGVKLIYSGIRYVFFPKPDILKDVKTAMSLIQKYKDFVVGFDLVGQEGLGKPLLYYLDALLYPSQQSPPVNLPYFFHSGETKWQDTIVDYNLVDALLLNTTRIGHGFALTKHPYIKNMVEKRGIAVELNPISNQVLKLVDDIRNHPGAILMTKKFPVVVSSDDPAVWGAKPLSHDFYMAFMGMCGADEGIAILKQLAYNSIQYSAMTNAEKTNAFQSWEQRWNAFIKDLVRQHHSRITSLSIVG
ncbi:hypothetical protein LOTGIDRAFT_215090 [Lottia gigantea]|uniref:adenosine deaminase n=1 Tax=Lottia gigantea TaxID=225164 RepID=V4AF16_LOTGI|nr:hypothetical protein LOTGIDRAFT_215090 [Lottia gigantea]ESO95457.1 hypothetical protein LOTGIDRAFT_215090 [Lottia gigantea]